MQSAADDGTLNDERARRLVTRAAYLENGTNPYPEHSEVTHYAVDIEARYASLADGENTEDVVKIGGRIIAKRGQGKIVFVVLRDTTADIQLFCRINDMSESDWELLGRLIWAISSTWKASWCARSAASFPWPRAISSFSRRPCVRCLRNSTACPTRKRAIVSAMSI